MWLKIILRKRYEQHCESEEVIQLARDRSVVLPMCLSVQEIMLIPGAPIIAEEWPISPKLFV